ncbi:ABC transporter substrate-binding protein [Embleya sp. NPDC050154]|uniref:ABC transporter substrate-binding protein n=1 Tax=unclassified Embleya TaxID=2699296 RepID=UPI0037A1C9AC
MTRRSELPGPPPGHRRRAVAEESDAANGTGHAAAGRRTGSVRMRRVSRGAGAAVALGLLAAGCGGTDSGGTSTGGNTITIGVPGDPGGMNPLTTLASSAVMMNRFAYDSLVNIRPDGRIASGIAETWTADTTTANFTLRRGVMCDDGTSLTPSAIAAQYNYIGDPANKSPMAGLLVPVGATATADDAAGTLTLKAPESAPFLLRSAGTVQLVCPSGMRSQEKLDQASDGTGPYRLTEVVAGDHFTFTKRPGYTWGPDGADNAATPDRVVFKFVGNESTRTNLLLGGQLDVARVIGADRARLAAAGLGFEIQRDPFGMLLFNEAPNRVTADARVRWAMIAALDLKQIGAVATGGKGAPATRLGTTMAPPCPTDSVTANLPPHDVARAAEALRAAGWKKSGGRWSKDGRQLSLSMPYPGYQGTQVIAAVELAVRQWKAFGVKVDTSQTSQSTNVSTLMAGQWDIAWAPISVPTPDQNLVFFSGPKPAEGLNLGATDNPEYQRLTAEAMTKPDTAGCPEWTAAEAELIKRVDVVTFMDSNSPWFTRRYAFEVDGGGILPTTLRRAGKR